MTLSELIVELQALEVDAGDHVVLLASDAEGNSFSKLEMNCLSVGVAQEEGYSIEYRELHEDDEEEDDPEGDPCICIWP